MTVIPILLYHGVSNDPSLVNAPYTVSPKVFEQHMNVIADAGYQTMTVSQLVDEIRTGGVSLAAEDNRVALVTFDDGYADFASNALPLMAEREIASTIYLTTGFLAGGTTEPLPRPTEPMLDWGELPELAARGVEIGSHSHSHLQMDTLTPGRSWDEITRSKAMLEDALGTTVKSFAYPHGYNSRHLRRQVQLAGFESASGVRNALSHTEDDLFRIARLMVMSDTPISQIQAWLDRRDAPVAVNREHLRTQIWRNYRRSKSLISGKPGTAYK